MSGALAGDWLAAVGLLLLAVGTGAQAWGDLTEFRDLLKELPAAGRAALDAHLPAPVMSVARTLQGLQDADIPYVIPTAVSLFVQLLLILLRVIIDIPPALKKIRATTGNDDAARVAKLI